jgi:hypothetical protein
VKTVLSSFAPWQRLFIVIAMNISNQFLELGLSN